MVRFAQLVMLVLLAGLASACASSTPQPTLPAPTVTSPVLAFPTLAPELTPTLRPVRSNFALYRSETGKFSIQHPLGWTVYEDSGLVELRSPDQAALARILFEPVDASLLNEELAQRAVDQLQQRYGKGFIEDARRVQNDQSVSIDFTIAEEPQLLGKLFVEGREGMFYQLILLIAEDQLARYENDINFIISSYALPGTSRQSTGHDPQSRVRRFFYELAEAFSDPLLNEEQIQLLRARRVVSYFPPDSRAAAEQEFKLVFGELGSTLASYRAGGEDIQIRATVQDLSTRLVSETSTTAEVEIERGTLTTTFIGDDVDLLPLSEAERSSAKPLSSFLRGQDRVRLVLVGGVWYIDPSA